MKHWCWWCGCHSWGRPISTRCHMCWVDCPMVFWWVRHSHNGVAQHLSMTMRLVGLKSVMRWCLFKLPATRRLIKWESCQKLSETVWKFQKIDKNSHKNVLLSIKWTFKINQAIYHKCSGYFCPMSGKINNQIDHK